MNLKECLLFQSLGRDSVLSDIDQRLYAWCDELFQSLGRDSVLSDRL